MTAFAGLRERAVCLTALTRTGLSQSEACKPVNRIIISCYTRCHKAVLVSIRADTGGNLFVSSALYVIEILPYPKGNRRHCEFSRRARATGCVARSFFNGPTAFATAASWPRRAVFYKRSSFCNLPFFTP